MRSRDTGRSTMANGPRRDGMLSGTGEGGRLDRSAAAADPLALGELTAVSFMNAYTHGRSGGDVAFIELFKRLGWGTHTVVTSALGRELCLSMGLPARFVPTTRESAFRGVIATYLRRMALGCLRAAALPVPDVIHATSDILPDVLPALVLKAKAALLRRRAVYIQKFYHLNQPGRRLSAWSQRCSLWLIRRTADRIITASRISGDTLQGLGTAPRQIAVNPIGIDLDAIERAAPGDERYDGVFLGRLKDSKGVFDLPLIWKRVAARIPGAMLAVIGEGDPQTRTALEARIAAEGLGGRIRLLGYLPDQVARGVLKAAKLFVFPSYEEGFGIALAEAMACGVPVVAYDLPVYRELYGDAVLRAPCFDARAFGELAAALLSDPERRRRLAQLGERVVRQFSWEASAAREAQIIREACLEHGLFDHRSGQGDQ